MSGFELVTVLGLLGVLVYVFRQRFSLAWEYLVTWVLHVPRTYKKLKHENKMLSESLDYSRRLTTSLKENIRTLAAGYDKQLFTANKEVDAHRSTIECYSKLLVEERFEGFTQAKQIGDLKHEKDRLWQRIKELETQIHTANMLDEAQAPNAKTRKKKTTFPALYKRTRRT